MQCRFLDGVKATMGSVSVIIMMGERLSVPENWQAPLTPGVSPCKSAIDWDVPRHVFFEVFVRGDVWSPGKILHDPVPAVGVHLPTTMDSFMIALH